ncbi:MAG: hypothetical protein Q4F72_12220 [Desulfovibrionaceae bacterium]|nr:hypothetical protein [Desulfovibrionaceae bacterium]
MKLKSVAALAACAILALSLFCAPSDSGAAGNDAYKRSPVIMGFYLDQTGRDIQRALKRQNWIVLNTQEVDNGYIVNVGQKGMEPELSLVLNSANLDASDTRVQTIYFEGLFSAYDSQGTHWNSQEVSFFYSQLKQVAEYDEYDSVKGNIQRKHIVNLKEDWYMQLCFTDNKMDYARMTRASASFEPMSPPNFEMNMK